MDINYHVIIINFSLMFIHALFDKLAVYLSFIFPISEIICTFASQK